MFEGVVDAASDLMGTPWIYFIIVGVALLDGLLPFSPSDEVVILCGVFAVNGEPNLIAVIAVAWLGAFAGDHIAYSIGRFAGSGFADRRHGRRRAAIDWIRGMLNRRGGLVVITARFLPGGRTLTNMTAGAVRYPLRSFSSYDAIGTLTWAVYTGLIGYLGGATFSGNPLLGVVFGITLALGVAAVIEVVRRVLQHARVTNADDRSDDSAVASTVQRAALSRKTGTMERH